MARDIPVGNGKLLVCFDSDYCMRDLYFPHVGLENHLGGNYSRFGVWVDGLFSWIGSGWTIDLKYSTDTLVTEVALYNQDLGLLLQCRDAVDFHENVFLREITVENLKKEEREIRLFFAHDLDISGNSVGDTAAYDPVTGGVVHYKDAIYFMANAHAAKVEGLAGFAVGQKNIGNLQGTFRDAEDGILSGNSIAQGSVDSVISVSLSVEGGSRESAYYWLSAGESWQEVRRLDATVKDKGPENLIARTSFYWRLWIRKEDHRLELLPDNVGNLYRRSLLILRTQIDWQGGIIAANDSDVVRFNRDTYSYVWPRDGSLVAAALDVAGYAPLSQSFYRFVANLIEKGGYLLHKYNPDGTLASSWHPWLRNGEIQLPIQEDETALVVWALWHHFVRDRDVEFIKPLYKAFVKRAADFMCKHRDSETGLPSASYDLWEERWGVHAFTVGAVFAGLTAASLFCRAFGEEERADSYMKAAAEIRDAASTYLWREDLNRFCRMIWRNDKGDLEIDRTRDSSVWGLFTFGLYSARDPKIISTMRDLKDKLWVNGPIGGMARYEGDYYHRADSEVPGNPWFICTLWFADFLADKAVDEHELAEAVEILEWVTAHALPSGVLAEQVHPVTGEPLSVSPLTWSHATFVSTVHRLLHRLGEVKICPECGLALTERAPKEHWIGAFYSSACESIYDLCLVK